MTISNSRLLGTVPSSFSWHCFASQEVKNNAFAQLRGALRDQWMIETCLKEDWHKAVLVPSLFFFGDSDICAYSDLQYFFGGWVRCGSHVSPSFFIFSIFFFSSPKIIQCLGAFPHKNSTKNDGGFICDMLGISTSEVQRIGGLGTFWGTQRKKAGWGHLEG